MNRKVQIIAPSSGCVNALEKLKQSIELLESSGFNVLETKDLFATMPFYANSLEVRLRHLREAILNTDVDIIWCFRGGYGAGEIVHRCFDIKPSHRKILIGYSDITALHYLFSRYNMPSLHAPVLTSLLGNQSHHITDIMNAIDGQDIVMPLNNVNSIRSAAIRGQISGGNLCVTTTMIGTKLHPSFKNKILFLEDIDEKGYAIMRYLNHLMQSGSLDDVAAIIFGSFIHSDQHAEYAIQAFCARYPYINAFRTDKIGHATQNIPIIIGADAVIEKNILTISNPWRTL